MGTTAKKMYWFAAAPLISSAISFISLPILTLRLGAEDYGIFGLGVVAASLIAGIGSLGVQLYLGGQQLSDEQRRDAVTTAALVAVLGGIVIAVGVSLAGWGAQNWAADIFAKQQGVMAFIVVIGLCGAFNAVASDAMVHFGSARAYSLCVVAYALTFAVTAYVCAFYWRADASALYAAGTAGAMAQSLFGGVAVKRHLTGIASRKSITALWKVAKPTLGVTYIQVTRTLVERWLIGLVVGLNLLGLFFHAQQYRSIILLVIKIPDKAFWQTTLTEATASSVNFGQMTLVWRFIDNVVFLAGLFFVLVGGEAIGLLTHGKFSDAAPFAAIWMAIMLFQNMGRPYNAVIIAHGKAAKLSQISLKSNLFVFVGIPVAIFTFGLWGLFAILAMGGLLTWALSRREAMKISNIDLPDTRPFALAMMVIGAQLASTYFEPELLVRFVLMAVCFAVFLVSVVRGAAVRHLLAARIANQV